MDEASIGPALGIGRRSRGRRSKDSPRLSTLKDKEGSVARDLVSGDAGCLVVRWRILARNGFCYSVGPAGGYLDLG